MEGSGRLAWVPTFSPKEGVKGAAPESVLHDLGEVLRVEAGAADQCAVNLLLRHQSGGVVRLYAAAVENAQPRSKIVAEGFGRFVTNDGMSVGGHRRSCSLAGADCPDGFIGDRHLGGFFC